MNQDENKYINNSSGLVSEKATKNIEENNSSELNFNKEKRENYENLMSSSATNLDGYWDKNNPVVRFILFALAAIIVGGIVYFFMMMSS